MKNTRYNQGIGRFIIDQMLTKVSESEENKRIVLMQVMVVLI